jgi:hypothetical protein
MKDPRVVITNLLTEYERLCDLFCFTPEKHWQWQDAKTYLEETKEESPNEDA